MTIAKLANVEEVDVINFLSEEKDVSIEVKYRLAYVIMTLRFLFKDLES